jgi:putative flavoprotein involved in K+ transport
VVRAADVVIVGAGQAGLATSWRLTGLGVEHVVLEADRIGSTWLTRRWASFRLVSPDHLNELPGGGPVGDDPDSFPAAAAFADYLERYAGSFGAPVERGVRVTRVLPVVGSGVRRFRLETSAGPMDARAVVVATGAFGDPVVPAVSANVPSRIGQLTTDEYRSPAALPPGGVLVVGAGQSGCQIADELARAGRDTWLAVGRWGWVPRRPWGTDQMDWRLSIRPTSRTPSRRWPAGARPTSTLGPWPIPGCAWSGA